MKYEIKLISPAIDHERPIPDNVTFFPVLGVFNRARWPEDGGGGTSTNSGQLPYTMMGKIEKFHLDKWFAAPFRMGCDLRRRHFSTPFGLFS